MRHGHGDFCRGLNSGVSEQKRSAGLFIPRQLTRGGRRWCDRRLPPDPLQALLPVTLPATSRLPHDPDVDHGSTAEPLDCWRLLTKPPSSTKNKMSRRPQQAARGSHSGYRLPAGYRQSIPSMVAGARTLSIFVLPVFARGHRYGQDDANYSAKSQPGPDQVPPGIAGTTGPPAPSPCPSRLEAVEACQATVPIHWMLCASDHQYTGIRSSLTNTTGRRRLAKVLERHWRSSLQ